MRRARACTAASAAERSCSPPTPSSTPVPAGPASPSRPTSSTSSCGPTTASSCAGPRSSARPATPTSGTSSTTAPRTVAASATASTAAPWSSRRSNRQRRAGLLLDGAAGAEVVEAHGQCHRLGAGVDLELADRVADVGVDGRRAQLQPLGDLFHPQPLGQELEDLALAGREVEQFLHLGGLAAGEVAAEEGPSPGHRFDRAGDVLGRG